MQEKVSCVYLINEQNQLLAHKRSAVLGGAYSTPGGSIDYGESAKEAASRELFEEAGIRLCEKNLIIFDRTLKGHVAFVAFVNSKEIYIRGPIETCRWEIDMRCDFSDQIGSVKIFGTGHAWIPLSTFESSDIIVTRFVNKIKDFTF